MQLGKKSGSREKRLEERRDRTGLKWAQAGRPAQPRPGSAEDGRIRDSWDGAAGEDAAFPRPLPVAFPRNTP